MKKVEIARSFAYKLNTGNYQTVDFFCSQKAEVPESEAEKTSERLYEFCKSEVIKSVNKYKQDNKIEKPKKKPPTPFVQALKDAPKSQADQEKSEELGEQEIKNGNG